jgi:nicotinate-nucleotide adenylyltransferase
MIGILGGTFDPIHHGHLRSALELLQDLGLEEVRLIPCRTPPHRGMPSATPEQRLAMVRAAVAPQPGLRADERELDRDGASYTIDTLQSLRAELGDATPLCLILGADAFLGLPTWHRGTELIEFAHLVVMHRPGWEAPLSGPVAELADRRRIEDPAGLRDASAGHVLFWPVTQLDISATRIRADVRAGKSPRYLVPDAVWELIQTEEIYGYMANTPD